jgi:hypothetical protein
VDVVNIEWKGCAVTAIRMKNRSTQQSGAERLDQAKGSKTAAHFVLTPGPQP